jgi:hypothetical protein
MLDLGELNVIKSLRCIAGCAGMLAILGCCIGGFWVHRVETDDYISCKDTRASFARGRFQIVDAYDANYVLCDMETDKALIDPVCDWRSDNGFAYVRGKEDLFAVIDPVRKECHLFCGLERVPVEYRDECSKLRQK